MTRRKMTPFHLAAVSIFSVALYIDVFLWDTFGPEFPLFYFYTDGLSFTQMLRAYTYTTLMSYRPTSHALFYWIGAQFMGWHDIAPWKLYHFATALAACWSVYWFAVRCLSGAPMAGFFAALYFIAHPSLYAFVMNPFDFIYVVLTILSAGSYLRGGRASTAAAWLLFVVALTTKEMALAIPLFLLVASAVAILMDRERPLRARIAGETLRLLPFFAMLPVYYFFHIVKIPPDAFTAEGPYRSGVNWDAIFRNLRSLPLWALRIFAFTGETAGQKMYQSNLVNNVAGAALLALTAVPWIARGWTDRRARAVLLLMLCWWGVFLILPVYVGGFIWHVHLPLIGYGVLFGFAMAWWLEKIPARPRGGAAAALLTLLLLLLSRWNLRTELQGGVHTTGFRINHSLIQHPPVARERLGSAPLIYIEDRLGIGGWWYGCYGKLFNFVYLRHDLEEVIVPELPEVPVPLRKRWLERTNAYFFRYDRRFRWRDASDEFRAAILQPHSVQPPSACVAAGRQVQLTLMSGDTEGGPLTWSLSPPDAGAIDNAGLYTAPAEIPEHQTVRVSAHRPGSAAPLATATLTLAGPLPIRVAAGSGKLTDSAARVWSADTNYNGGHTFFSAGPIENSNTPELYRNERFHGSPLRYRFCVPEGSYTVTLKFAEIWFAKAGERVFDVAINDQAVLEKFDVAAAAGGPRRAIDKEFRVEAPDGEIRIELKPVLASPKINAIEIAPLP
jgi:hypothetical protein